MGAAGGDGVAALASQCNPEKHGSPFRTGPAIVSFVHFLRVGGQNAWRGIVSEYRLQYVCTYEAVAI